MVVETTKEQFAIPRPDRELCFDPKALLTDGAPLDGFIASVRMRAPLSVLRDDLRALIETTREQLVANVQNEFSTFVNLGTAITDVDALVDSAAKPLVGLRKDIASLLTELDADNDTLTQTLEERKNLAARAAALKILLRSNDLLLKCERLLKDYAAIHDKTSSEALRLLERIAGECAQLSFVLSRAGNGTFVQSISPRISTVRNSVRTNLEHWLQRVLFQRTPSRIDVAPYESETLARVLAAYVVVGIASDAEDFFRREIVVPFCAARIRMTTMLAVAERNARTKAADSTPISVTSVGNRSDVPSDLPSHPASNSQGVDHSSDLLDSAQSAQVRSVTAADAFEALEQEVVDFLGEKVMPILSLCDADERLRNRLHVLENAVWPPIAKAITTHMSAAFSPGNPDVFHKSVLSASRLYAAMESATSSEARICTLRQSTATKELWRNWNLPVYFQLRFQEITSIYDNCLRQGPVKVESLDSDVSRRPGFVSTDEKGTSAFASSIPSSQLGSTNYQILRSDMYQVKATVAMVHALRTCWSDSIYLKALAHRFLRLSFQLLVRYVTWVRTGLAGEWADPGAIPTGAAHVYADVIVLQERLPAELIRMLRRPEIGIPATVLQEIDSEFSDAVATPPEETMVGTSTRLGSLLPDLERSISDALSRSCVDNLQPLRGILATYRMSTKAVPATHSSFVQKVLVPLKSFLREHRGRLKDDVCQRIASTVIEATTSKYYEMATDFISSNKKSEETLRRLNIGGTAGVQGVRLSTIQLYLDVAKFKDDVQSLGVSPDTVPSMKDLWNSVKQEEQTE